MKIAIMQPYFFPYIGYFQLLNAADKFVVYDNIKYTKKGWINRNRIMVGCKDQLFTIPLRNASDYLDIRDRYLSEDAADELKKVLRRIQASYGSSPYYHEVYPLIESCFLYEHKNLFHYLYHSIAQISSFLGITTEIMVSSHIQANHELKGEMRVLSICKSLQATDYINAIGGTELYSKETFSDQNLNLHFLKTNAITYRQSAADAFIPNLSIIDVLMYNGKEGTKALLNQFELV